MLFFPSSNLGCTGYFKQVDGDGDDEYMPGVAATSRNAFGRSTRGKKSKRGRNSLKKIAERLRKTTSPYQSLVPKNEEQARRLSQNFKRHKEW